MCEIQFIKLCSIHEFLVFNFVLFSDIFKKSPTYIKSSKFTLNSLNKCFKICLNISKMKIFIFHPNLK